MKHESQFRPSRGARSPRYAAVARIGLGLAINVTGLFVLVTGLLPVGAPFV